MKRQLSSLLILILTLNLAACSNSQAIEVQDTPVLKLDLAFVEDITLSQVTAEKITLTAHGQLPDACSKIEKSEIEQADTAIIVSIFTSQATNSSCATGPSDFSEEISIDLASLPGISKTIIVNGISASIDIPALENDSDEILKTPTPTPETKIPISEEEKEDAPANSQDDQADIQTSSSASEALQPTQIAGVSTQQSTNEDDVSDSNEMEESQSNETVAAQSKEASQPTSVPPEPNPQPGQCEDKAAFYADVTVPDDTIFKPGDKFEKVWRIRNEGTCTWSSAYALVFASGEIMNGALSNPLPGIAPGEITEISIELQAPARWGQYTGNWQFQNDHGERFGVGAGGHDYIWVQIFVDSPAPAPPSNPPAGQPSDPPAQPPVQNPAGCGIQRNDSFEQQVLGLINNARTNQGLSSLTLQSQLSNAAYRHSSDMACHDFIGHSGSDASSWYDRVSAQGYTNYNSARENIYVGDPQFGGTPDGAFDWWMNSQVHRDNILNPDVLEIGIGYTYNPDSSYGGYYTVVFARP